MRPTSRKLEVILRYVQDDNAQADLERAFEMLLAVEPTPEAGFDRLPPQSNTPDASH